MKIDEIKKNILSTEEASSSGFLEGSNFFMSSRLTDITPLTGTSKSGYCRLFKAVRMGKWCVLKCLRPEYADNPEFIALLQKEFEISYKLSHPNIVQMIGLEQIEGLGACIIMEYIDGSTLSEWMKSNKRSRDEVIATMRSIGNALDYIHQQHIVHRDIKPSNILVTRNGNYVKIIDFGIADADNYAILKQPAGTRHYIAPEQTEGKLPLDGRADIYSFGVILQEMNRFLNHRSVRLRHIARKCCEEDRDKRYSSLSEIKWESRFVNVWEIAFICLFVACLIIGWQMITRYTKIANEHDVLKTTNISDSSRTKKDSSQSATATSYTATNGILQNTKQTASSDIKVQNEKISKLESQIRKMTRNNWDKYVRYLESRPKELINETSSERLGEKIRNVQYSYKTRLNKQIRDLVSTITDTKAPAFAVMLGSAEAISQSETTKIDYDPQCEKRQDDAMQKIIDANGKYIEEHQQEGKQ